MAGCGWSWVVSLKLWLIMGRGDKIMVDCGWYQQNCSWSWMVLDHKCIFYIFLNIFFIYIRKSKSLSAKYYQENKERLQIKASERYQNLSKEEKEKK